jgi:predicted ATPase/DNA-binding SARP family transcriptional activator
MVDITQDNKPPALALTLFGPFEVRVQGMPLPRLHSRKVAWLLALLTLRQGKPVERDWLVGTLWPDSSQSQALAYLRQSLTELRRALSTEATRLQAPTRHTLALDLSSADVDLLTFDTGIQQGDLLSLARAVEVYRGPLLEGCTEEWALQERAGREQSCLTALQRLAEDALARGEAGIAVGYLRRVVAVDALQEGAQRALMQALVLEGSYAAATQVYRDLRLHLHRELNAEPGPQTTAVYNQIRAQTRQKAQTVPRAAPGLAASPPPRQLPHPLTDLVGREADIVETAARLRQRRLLTLTGTGGVGKTRLAIAVAETLAEEYADGAWFVDLAGLSDAGLVVQSVATTLGVREEPGGSLQEALVSFLRPKLLLLVLDNCEHLLQACAQLAGDLLQGCTGVRILATSRQALRITGEVEWQVPSLPVPDLAHLPTEAAGLLAAVSECASVQLFVERAEAVQKAFALTTRNAFSVAQICHRLDGIPLALELAASNVKALPIEEIARRLDDVFRLLTRGSRTALPRQQTLQATLDWSYDLLTEAERSLLQRLSVFSGGWNLEAAEQVCADKNDDKMPVSSALIEEWEVLDVLTSLVDKSLVQVEEQEGCVRYRMLETVRQYAAEKLPLSGETQTLKSRHWDYFLALAEEAEPRLMGPDQALWFDRLETEHDNLRAALSWCGHAEVTGIQGLRFATALSEFWTYRGYGAEGRDCLEQAIARYHALGSQTPVPAILPRAYTALGILYYRQSDYTSAMRHYECAVEIVRQIGPPKQEAFLLKLMGNIAYNQGRLESAQELYQASLTLYRRLEDRLSEAHVRDSLGNVAYARGDYALARNMQEEALPLMRAAQDPVSLSITLHNLGNTALALGDLDVALTWMNESLAIAREVGNQSTVAFNLCHLAVVAMRQNDFERATTLLQESLRLFYKLGNKSMIAELFETCAELSMLQEDISRCVRLCAAAAALREQIGEPLNTPDRARQDQVIRRARETLGADYAVCYATGRAMSLDQAYALTLNL